MLYYLYIILCKDGSFYTGYTKNLDLRMKLHMNGKAARYTRMHKPKELVYVKKFSSQVEAMRNERRAKRLNHRQKLKLINSQIKPKQHHENRKNY